VRDKVPQQEEWNKKGLVFHSTQDIIQAIASGKARSGAEMPTKIMFTFHPQRWTDNPVLWMKELLMQAAKNWVKSLIVRRGEKK
jgi:hypothetical protein